MGWLVREERRGVSGSSRIEGVDISAPEPGLPPDVMSSVVRLRPLLQQPEVEGLGRDVGTGHVMSSLGSWSHSFDTKNALAPEDRGSN